MNSYEKMDLLRNAGVELPSVLDNDFEAMYHLADKIKKFWGVKVLFFEDASENELLAIAKPALDSTSVIDYLVIRVTSDDFKVIEHIQERPNHRRSRTDYLAKWGEWEVIDETLEG